jgi:hypothetical protein
MLGAALSVTLTLGALTLRASAGSVQPIPTADAKVVADFAIIRVPAKVTIRVPTNVWVGPEGPHSGWSPPSLREWGLR